MAFTIYVKNKGEDGTVEISERLNLGENKIVFNAVISAGDTISVNCEGTAPKDFDWTHHATGMSDGPISVDANETLEVYS